MKKTLLLFLIAIILPVWAFAQFPTFYPTYQRKFVIGEDKFSTLPSNEELFKKLKKASKGEEIVVDPNSAYEISCYYYDLIKDLEESENKKRAEISRIQANEAGRATNEENLIRLASDLVKLQEDKQQAKVLAGYFGAINRYYGKPKFLTRFYPVRKATQANFFFNNVSSSGLSTLNSFVIQGNSDKGIANTEVVSGLIGPVRASFTSVFYASSEQDSLEVNTKLFNGGGLTNLHFEAPLLYYNHPNFLMYSAFKPGLIADIPIFGSDIERDSFSGYYELPIEFLIEFRTNEKNFSLFANFKGSRIAGTEAFYNTLKTTDKLAEDQKLNAFWISQVYFGISVSENFRITANVPIATTSKIEMPDKIQIGLQILTNSNK